MDSGLSFGISVYLNDLFTAGATKVQAQLEGMVASFSRAAQTVRDSWMAFFPVAMLGEAGRGLLRPFQRMIDASTLFQTRMADIQSIWNQSADTLDELRQKIQELAITGAQVPETTAMAAYRVISADFTRLQDIVQILDASQKMAVAGLTDMDTATVALTATLNSFNMSAAEAAHMADLFFTTVATGQTRMNQLAEAIPYIAPLAYGLFTPEEMFAAFATLTVHGIAPSTAGRYLRSLEQQLIKKPTPQQLRGAQMLVDLGVVPQSFVSGQPFAASILQMGGMMKFVEAVAQGFERMDEASRKLFLSLMFGNQLAMPAMQAMVTSLRVMEDIFAKMQESSGETKRAFGTIASTWQFQSQRMSALNVLETNLTLAINLS